MGYEFLGIPISGQSNNRKGGRKKKETFIYDYRDLSNTLNLNGDIQSVKVNSKKKEIEIELIK